MNNKKVVYVSIPGNTGYKYPVYVPIIVEEPEVYKATGRLSEGDYKKTTDNLAGFPAIIPILRALAPFVPYAIQGVSKLINKIGSNKSSQGGYIPTNPNIKTLKDIQGLYDKYD